MAKGRITRRYSRGTTVLKYLAPARHQHFETSLILATRTPTGTAVLRKTRAFLSFQISHEINIIRDIIARRDCDALESMRFHQAFTEWTVTQAVGFTSTKPSQDLIISQTRTSGIGKEGEPRFPELACRGGSDHS